MTTEIGVAELTVAQVEAQIAQVGDVETLLHLSREEADGPHRRGVLNAIQNRIGAVMVERQSGPLAPVDPANAVDPYGPAAFRQPEPLVPVGAGSPLTTEMMKLAANDQVTETTQDIFDLASNQAKRDEQAIAAGTITHRSAPLVLLYAPTDHGFVPTTVPAGNVLDCLKRGFSAVCPDCGRDNCRVNGDQNDCPAIEARKFAWCPVGRHKRIYDPLPPRRKDGRAAAVAVAVVVDENEVALPQYDGLAPEARIKARMDQHLLAYHPEEAAAMGLVAQSPRERIAGSPQLGPNVPGEA